MSPISSYSPPGWSRSQQPFPVKAQEIRKALQDVACTATTCLCEGSESSHRRHGNQGARLCPDEAPLPERGQAKCVNPWVKGMAISSSEHCIKNVRSRDHSVKNFTGSGKDGCCWNPEP